MVWKRSLENSEEIPADLNSQNQHWWNSWSVASYEKPNSRGMGPKAFGKSCPVDVGSVVLSP